MQHWKSWTYGVYICNKIIYATKFEIVYIYFKTKVMGGILGDFLKGCEWYWFTSIKSTTI
jgi:hypothetical protein